MVVTLAGEENMVSEMKAGCLDAACTGESRCAGHGALQGMNCSRLTSIN